MDRIGPAGGSPTQTLTDGQQGFVDENLGTGQEGTNVPAEWMNAVQEELMNLLAQAGVTPNILNWTQVYQSILTIIAQQLAGTANLTGVPQFYFKVPIGSKTLIVQGGQMLLNAGVPEISYLLPTTFPNGFIAAAAIDGLGIYFWGIGAGVDNSHVNISCQLQQLVGGSIVTRSNAGGSFICVGY